MSGASDSGLGGSRKTSYAGMEGGDRDTSSAAAYELGGKQDGGTFSIDDISLNSLTMLYQAACHVDQVDTNNFNPRNAASCHTSQGNILGVMYPINKGGTYPSGQGVSDLSSHINEHVSYHRSEAPLKDHVTSAFNNNVASNNVEGQIVTSTASQSGRRGAICGVPGYERLTDVGPPEQPMDLTTRSDDRRSDNINVMTSSVAATAGISAEPHCDVNEYIYIYENVGPMASSSHPSNISPSESLHVSNNEATPSVVCSRNVPSSSSQRSRKINIHPFR